MHMLQFVLAIIGLGFLIFIHELGHYFVAKKCGMRIQVFSIGFGKPFFSWKRGTVKWQLCYCLLGGYVKIAGMQKEGRTPPHKVKGGFYSKKPGARIAVAFAGPLVNIVGAFLLFCLIFVIGGRHKPFAEHTQIIGQLDTRSELYKKGVRTGDQIISFDDRPYGGMRDMQYVMVQKPSHTIDVAGMSVDYNSGVRTPFNYHVLPYPDPRIFDRDIYTIGIFYPASYLIYSQEMPAGSPMQESGIEIGDRIVWANGERIFSQMQFAKVINGKTVMLSVQNGSGTKLVRVPVFRIAQLRTSSAYKGELDDWHYAAGHKNLNEALFLPYELSSNLSVERSLAYIDQDAKEQTQWAGEQKLLPGDRIQAVNGVAITNGVDLMNALQMRQVQVIVKKDSLIDPMNWKLADERFETEINSQDLDKITRALAQGQRIETAGDLKLLNPVTPVPLKEFPVPEAQKKRMKHEETLRQEEIEQIDDPETKAEAKARLAAYTGRLMLGIPLTDRTVIYNPSPWILFKNTFQDIGKTFIGLVSGSLSPKWISGPVGIVQVLHQSWGLGLGEALFWLAVISLNLGILNLLPIPPFDGGHIVFSIYEGATGRRISQKIMDRIAIGFLILIAGFALYVTFHDVLRLVGRFL